MQDISATNTFAFTVSPIVSHRSIFDFTTHNNSTNSDWFYVTSLIRLLCVTFPNTFVVTRSQCHQHTRHCWPEVTHVMQKLIPFSLSSSLSLSLSAFYLLSLTKGGGEVHPAMREANTANKNKHYRAIQTYSYPKWTQYKGTLQVRACIHIYVTARTFSDASEEIKVGA